jgi:hypothetical protein
MGMHNPDCQLNREDATKESFKPCPAWPNEPGAGRRSRSPRLIRRSAVPTTPSDAADNRPRAIRTEPRSGAPRVKARRRPQQRAIDDLSCVRSAGGANAQTLHESRASGGEQTALELDHQGRDSRRLVHCQGFRLAVLDMGSAFASQ